MLASQILSCLILIVLIFQTPVLLSLQMILVLNIYRNMFLYFFLIFRSMAHVLLFPVNLAHIYFLYILFLYSGYMKNPVFSTANRAKLSILSDFSKKTVTVNGNFAKLFLSIEKLTLGALKKHPGDSGGISGMVQFFENS